MPMQMTPNQLFDRMLTYGGDICLEQMLKDKGEKDVKSSAWAKVNAKHGERDVLLERTMTVEF